MRVMAKYLAARRLTATFFMLLLLLSTAAFTPPAQAGTIEGVIEDDHVHLEVHLEVNFSEVADSLAERNVTDYNKIKQQLKKWIKERHRWREGEDWTLEELYEKLNETGFDEIPPGLNKSIVKRIREYLQDRKRLEKELHKHVDPVVSCWLTPALRNGLQNALRNNLNASLRRLFPNYEVRNLELEVDYNDTTKIYTVDIELDLYNAVTTNSSGTFVNGKFRYFNATGEIDPEEFGGKGLSKFTPSKAMFLDLSAFNVPLEEWTRNYDPESNTTEFSIERDIVVSTALGDIYVDPEASLVVGGEAIASGDAISVVQPLLEQPVTVVGVTVPLWMTLATLVATIAVVLSALAYRRRIIRALSH